MPMRPLKPCKSPMCPNLIEVGTSYCDTHKKALNKQYDKARPEYHRWYSESRWRSARISYLRSNPLCVICMSQGDLKAATVVDHKVDHKGSPKLFWDVSNWQALCVEHHNSKTASENNKGFNGRCEQ